MRKRIAGLILSAALVLAMVPEAAAADSGSITDISGHWAESSIVWAVDEGIFNGVSETEFAPNRTMTRGMFVTVLGRMAGVDPAEFQDVYLDNLFSDVSAGSYYAPYVNWAVRYGIAQGTGGEKFSPDTPVTRQQMATFLVRFCSIYNYELIGSDEGMVENFADASSIGSYAVDAVETMRKTGLMNGKRKADGTYVFDPKGNATRAQCATVLQRMSNAMRPYEGREIVAPDSIYVSAQADTLYVGDWTGVEAWVGPDNVSNGTVTWVSSDPSVVAVAIDGTVTAVGAGTAEIYGYTWNGLCDYTEITCLAKPTTSYEWESYEDKCIRVFGQVVDDPRRFYQTAEEAYSHMAVITVPVWDFADSSRTTKITTYKTLTVNANMADTIVAIFEEIYNGSEQFPIKEVGCYRWEPGSEHMPGLAIDINSYENYECTLDGTATAGAYWRPGEDPYSIPADGDVVNAFRKYGFGWGGNWNSKKDYMHFSYFST